jgi:hypothetical protein
MTSEIEIVCTRPAHVARLYIFYLTICLTEYIYLSIFPHFIDSLCIKHSLLIQHHRPVVCVAVNTLTQPCLYTGVEEHMCVF